MPRKTILMTLAGCLTILLSMVSLSSSAPLQQKIAALKFNGALSQDDQKYLGLEKPGPFTLQDIKAPYVLIEILRTT